MICLTSKKSYLKEKIIIIKCILVTGLWLSPGDFQINKYKPTLKSTHIHIICICDILLWWSLLHRYWKRKKFKVHEVNESITEKSEFQYPGPCDKAKARLGTVCQGQVAYKNLAFP